MAKTVVNGEERDKGRDDKGRWTSGNLGRKKGSKDKFSTLKNEFVKVFEQHGGPARLAELMAKSPGRSRFIVNSGTNKAG